MMAKRNLPALTPEDRALWDALKSEVRPLNSDSSHFKEFYSEIKKTPINRGRKLPPDLVWEAPGKFASTRNIIKNQRAPNDLREGGSTGLDRAGAERLRRGKMRIEGKLDLHGLTQREAQERLEAFVANSADLGKRHLLVITGKGSKSGGQGVLRARVPEWLGQGVLSRLVLAFSYAQKRDGEQGALYVLLRRSSRG